MKVIFLDIDGVVMPLSNSKRDSQDCAARVNRLVEATGAKVVISSSWRLDVLDARRGLDWRVAHEHPSWLSQEAWLKSDCGLAVPIIGFTPDLPRASDDPELEPWEHPPAHRGKEIRAWLAEHPDVASWVILDDQAKWIGQDMLDKTVLCVPATGLSDEGVERAIHLLSIPN